MALQAAAPPPPSQTRALGSGLQHVYIQKACVFRFYYLPTMFDALVLVKQ